MSYGRHTYGKAEVSTWDKGANLIVGNFCSIARGLQVFLSGNHRTDWVTTYPFGHINQNVFNSFSGEGHPLTNGDVVIGNDVWIGANATIMSGVTISDGAVIANNSHVVKNVEPYSVVGGNPAKHIKYRFTQDQIDKLLQIKWWDRDDDKVNEFAPLLCQPDINKFIKSCT